MTSATEPDTSHPGSPAPAWRPSAFHVLAKPTGATCNLDCDYCFFLSKELLYPGSRFRMTDEVLETYLRQLFDGHRRSDEVIVAWQGGEPTLMGLPFFERAVRIAHGLARPGQRVLHTLQTNGTLLDDAWAAFLARHRFLVGISIDGPPDVHDRYRVDKGGKPTLARVLRGLSALRRHHVDVNVLTTVHAANERRGREVYRFLRDECGAGFVQFIPIVERATPESVAAANAGWGERSRLRRLATLDGSLVTDRSVSPEGYGLFLVDVFEDWVRRDIGTTYVQMFDTTLANWVGEPGGLCVHSPVCGLQVALEHNGDVYSCDHFVEPRFRLGNIRELPLLDLVASPRQRRFGADKAGTLTASCRACDVRFACHGGCPKDRFVAADGEPGHHYLCPSYQTFFRHVAPTMTRMATLLRAGRAPSEVMAETRTTDSTRDPEAPCPCGAARPWATCHAQEPVPRA